MSVDRPREGGSPQRPPHTPNLARVTVPATSRPNRTQPTPRNDSARCEGPCAARHESHAHEKVQRSHAAQQRQSAVARRAKRRRTQREGGRQPAEAAVHRDRGDGAAPASDTVEAVHFDTDEERKLALYTACMRSQLYSTDGRVVWGDVCQAMGVASQNASGPLSQEWKRFKSGVGNGMAHATLQAKLASFQASVEQQQAMRAQGGAQVTCMDARLHGT